MVNDTLDRYFNNFEDVIIEGTGEKTWNLEGLSISLKDNGLKYFVLLTTNKKGIDWLIHFENYSDDPYTEDEKSILFNAINNIIKTGDVITTEGGVTPGGISALKRFKLLGYKQIGTKKGKSVYWASNRMLNQKRFNKWMTHADRKDYILIDKNGFPTVENTRPVIPILKKG